MKQEAITYYEQKKMKLANAHLRTRTTLSDLSNVKNIHMVGICGKAMASLAGLLQEAGYNVTGSDESWNPPMSTVLESIGISGNPFSIENLEGKQIDLVIMGNAYSPDNIETVYAREHNIPQMSSAEGYADFFIKDTTSLVVAGTHGKTTTTGLLGWTLISAGRKPHLLVGGVVENINESYSLGSSKTEFSIVEGDEYDTAYFDKAPKMLHYKPTIGIITSIEFDHADIYTDMEDYRNAFYFFAEEIPQYGALFICESVAEKEQLKSKCAGKTFVYGLSDSCDIFAKDIVVTEQGQTFTLVAFGEEYNDISITLFGEYNLLNALSVCGTLLHNNIPIEDIKKGLETFLGMKQRQEILCNVGGVIVMDDFAHHPTAVRETLSGLRSRFKDRRIVAVFEPRSNTSRRKDFEIPYTESFSSADVAYITAPAFRHNDNPENFMNPEYVVQVLNEKGKQAFSISDKDILLNQLVSNAKKGDVIILMSNGHFDGLKEKVAEAIRERFA